MCDAYVHQLDVICIYVVIDSNHEEIKTIGGYTVGDLNEFVPD